MKKIFTPLAALVMIASLCACESKMAESEPIVEEVIEETETPTEVIFTEYVEDEFETVDIGCDITDHDLPFDINVVDLKKYDLGERLSPCKAQEAYPYFSRQDYYKEVLANNTEQLNRYNDSLNKLLEIQSNGMIEDCVFLDGKYYFVVNYDDLCGCHDNSIFSCDAKTGEIKEVASRTGLQYTNYYKELAISHGKIYYLASFWTGEDENGNPVDPGLVDLGGKPVNKSNVRINEKTAIYSFDPTTDANEEICSFEGCSNWIFESKNGLMVGIYSSKYSNEQLMEYNFETKKLTEYSYEESFDSRRKPLCEGVEAEITGGTKQDNYSPITIKTQFYTLSTDLINYSDIYLWKDKVSIISNEVTGRTWMYTYDLERRERLKMKCDGFGDGEIIQTDDGWFEIGRSIIGNEGYNSKEGETMFYIQPLVGIINRAEKANAIRCGLSDNIFSYMTIKEEDGTFDSDNHFNIGYNTKKGLPDKLYWLELKTDAFSYTSTKYPKIK